MISFDTLEKPNAQPLDLISPDTPEDTVTRCVEIVFEFSIGKISHRQ